MQLGLSPSPPSPPPSPRYSLWDVFACTRMHRRARARALYSVSFRRARQVSLIMVLSLSLSLSLHGSLINKHFKSHGHFLPNEKINVLMLAWHVPPPKKLELHCCAFSVFSVVACSLFAAHICTLSRHPVNLDSELVYHAEPGNVLYCSCASKKIRLIDIFL